MEKNPSDELLSFLTRYPPAVVELFLAARDWLSCLAPEATEIITNASYSVACGFTFSHSIKHAFIYLGAYSRHVSIGFCEGASVADPERRLKGEGKSMRHLSYKTVESLGEPYDEGLIHAAILAAHRPPEPLIPKTVITKMKAAAPSA